MMPPADNYLLDRNDVRRRFERAAQRFDDADFVHAETRNGLLSRIEPLSVEAKVVVDLGSATSAAQRALSKRFGGAQIVSADLAHGMLQKGRAKKTWLAKYSYVQASATALPFDDLSIDVIFANLLLPWVDDPARAFSEIARVLRKGGVFAFATLGPDSLQELRRAWRQIDDMPHVNHFFDMHDLGDALVNAGLSDPVLDVDRLTVTYTNADRIFADLTASGGRNALRNRSRTLTGRHRFASMVADLEGAAIDGDIALGLELIYGHCWGAGRKIDPTNYRIDASQIPRWRQ